MAKDQQQHWVDAWYQGRWWLWLLLPLSGLFYLLAQLRKRRLVSSAQKNLPVPVVVVGNISLGGTGKTPLLIALVKHLQGKGYKPGVISRGYGGQAPHYPYRLDNQSSSAEAGDEPCLIQLGTGCPVVVGPDRHAAAERLLAESDCNIILSDDGLQHYRLARDIEIAVVDGERGVGNGFCLPAGPLRELPSRLNSVDFVVVNGRFNAARQLPVEDREAISQMTLAPAYWQSLVGARGGTDAAAKPLTVSEFIEQQCAAEPEKAFHAVAGIGNPARFYQTLAQVGINCQGHDFPDHHQYRPEDFDFDDGRPLLMTSKDAVKCQQFARDNWWYLAVEAVMPQSFWEAFERRVEQLVQAKDAA